MKLLKVLVAALLLVAMVTPAIAEDRLSLSGEMRVRGYIYDYDFDSDDNADDEDDSGAWNDTRMRIAGKIAVAEGVAVLFRFDAVESDDDNSNAVAWGGSNVVYQPYSQRRGDIQFDKAYLQVKKNGFTIEAGQMYFGGFGYTSAVVDAVGTGFSVAYGDFKALHIKQYDQNNGNDSFDCASYVDPDDDTNRICNDEDRTLTAIKYDFKGDGFSITPMASYVFGDIVKNSDFDRLVVAVAGMADLGPVALKGELDYLDGSIDDEFGDTTDNKGLQLYLDGSMAATDMIRVGGMFFYAKGYTDDDESQVTKQSMPVFADWHPESYGPWTTDFVAEFDAFDPGGTSGGVVAGSLYADVKATEDIDLKFAGMYFTPEDDEVDYDGYTLNASIAYKFAENTTLTSHLNYLSTSLNGDNGDPDEDYDVVQVMSGIQVKF
jgi:hypothetical protein